MIYVLLLVMSVLYSWQSLFCRLYTNARNSEGALQFSVFYGALAGVCTLAVNGFSFAPSRTTVALGVINAMILLTYNISMLKCGTLGSYAFMMISALAGGTLVPMVYDALYLGYEFSLLQLAAVALMLVAFVVMNIDGVKAKKNLRYLMWCGILFVVNGFYGVIMNLQQTLMNFTQRGEMIITTFLGMAVLTMAFEMIFARRTFLRGFRMNKKAAGAMIVSSVCATIAVNMLMIVMKSVNITVLSVINNGCILVLSALYAFLIFKEKVEKHTIVGMIAACASIIMLSI